MQAIQSDLLKDGSLGRLVVRLLKITGHTMRVSGGHVGGHVGRSNQKLVDYTLGDRPGRREASHVTHCIRAMGVKAWCAAAPTPACLPH
jgi:hypothetical protein